MISVYTVRISWNARSFAAQKAYELLVEPEFPSLADEIRPYMKMKVATFTVSEQSINTA